LFVWKVIIIIQEISCPPQVYIPHMSCETQYIAHVPKVQFKNEELHIYSC